VTTVTVTRGKVPRAVFTPGLVDGTGVAEPQTGVAAARIQDRYDRLRRCSGLADAPH
jgi:hypothetical protein